MSSADTHREKRLLAASLAGSTLASDKHPGCRAEASRLRSTYLGLWRKQGSAEAVHVAQVYLDAGVGEAQLVEAGGVVAGADVALAGEGGDGDGVLQLGLRQVVADAAVHVALRAPASETNKEMIIIKKQKGEVRLWINQRRCHLHLHNPLFQPNTAKGDKLLIESNKRNKGNL